MLKKLLSLFIAAILCASALPSCSQGAGRDGKIKILCTVFPLYDWACAVTEGSENVEVSLLVENGTDLHSFQPSFGDMAKIKDSDIVLYIGGESDRWVAESIDGGATALELSALDEITLYEASADRFASKHTHEDGEECHEAHDHAFDEHIWLSLKNATAACRALLSVLSEADNTNADLYRQNTETYTQRLSLLDEKMTAAAQSITSPVIFADRFPFVYLFEDYGIDYFAAFSGCSTDTGADFDTVITLAKKINEYSSKYIFVTERPIDGLAESIIAQSTDKTATVKALDSMQSVGKADIANGTSYISVMEQSINILAQQ